ncbi:MAG: 50S ribosomal protein L35 [Candidatus Moranbacteria bacterium]|nr:50S ribosomal protein L35 [Candidatus Moranbacteria bacterium]
MPKIKTKKAAAKKFTITKRRKVLRRHTGQNHYNSKETGKAGRIKKKDLRVFRTEEKSILKALPYTN